MNTTKTTNEKNGFITVKHAAELKEVFGDNEGSRVVKAMADNPQMTALEAIFAGFAEKKEG